MTPMQEEFLRGHMARMKDIDDRARNGVSVLSAEHVRNILSNGDAVVAIERQLGKDRINEIVEAVKNA